MTKRSTMIGLAIGVALDVSSPPTAQGSELLSIESVATAKQLMVSGRVEEARLLLQDLSQRYRDSNDIDFLMGLLEVDAKEYDRAIKHFRLILARQPKAVRVRLELARAFYLDRDYENAFRQFQFARAGDPPAGVIASIDHYLSLIRQQKNWSYNFSLAIAPDTNINNGTSDRETVLFGVPFELGDDARKRSGTGIAAEAGAEFAPRISELVRLRVGGVIQRRDYSGTDFDDMTIAAYVGPRMVLGKWDLSLTGTAFERRFGGRRLSRGYGSRIEATYYPDSRTGISFGVAAQQAHYPDFPLHSGSAFSGWGSIARALRPGSFATARIAAGETKAKAAELGNRSRAISLGYYRDLAGGFSVYAEPSYSKTRYGAADPFFGARRQDRLMELRFGLLNRRIDFRGFTPRLIVTLGKRQSSINIYNYSQRRIEAGMTRSF